MFKIIKEEINNKNFVLKVRTKYVYRYYGHNPNNVYGKSCGRVELTDNLDEAEFFTKEEAEKIANEGVYSVKSDSFASWSVYYKTVKVIDVSDKFNSDQKEIIPKVNYIIKQSNILKEQTNKLTSKYSPSSRSEVLETLQKIKDAVNSIDFKE